MTILSLITLSHAIYLNMCMVYSFVEENTEQRKEAFAHSNLNFFALYVLSRCVPFDELPPGNSNMILTLAVWVLLADIIFTVTHRLLHTKYLYWIHKKHHQNNPSYTASTYDAHLIEFLFGNVATGLVPMIVFPGSYTTQFIWIASANTNTILGHYKEGPHLTHHKLVKCNYGQGLYMWDRLFGTFK